MARPAVDLGVLDGQLPRENAAVVQSCVPLVHIIEALCERGAELRYHDPYVPTLVEHGLRSSPIDQLTADADAGVLVTAHPGVDYDSIANSALIFVDLRGATRHVSSPSLVTL